MQQPKFASSAAHRPIVVEVSGEPQGVLVPFEGGYRFLAVKFPVFAIDGQTFGSVEEARLAASSVVAASEAGQESKAGQELGE